MTDDAKQTAWREYCRKLEAIGVDPYAPEVPNDDPRHEQVVAIVAEYDGSRTHKLALPSNWEGHDPVQPVDSLPDLAEWLAFQWSMIKGLELAGEQAKPMAMEDASRAIRNAFRVLEWLGVDDRPERPLPADKLETAKSQIDDLERWIRRKNKSGWKPSPNSTPKTVATTIMKKHPKRDELPDDYEANIRIKQFLDSHPKATIRAVAEFVNLSVGKVQSLDAWKRAMAERKAEKPVPSWEEKGVRTLFWAGLVQLLDREGAEKGCRKGVRTIFFSGIKLERAECQLSVRQIWTTSVHDRPIGPPDPIRIYL